MFSFDTDVGNGSRDQVYRVTDRKEAKLSTRRAASLLVTNIVIGLRPEAVKGCRNGPEPVAKE